MIDPTITQQAAAHGIRVTPTTRQLPDNAPRRTNSSATRDLADRLTVRVTWPTGRYTEYKDGDQAEAAIKAELDSVQAAADEAHDRAAAWNQQRGTEDELRAAWSTIAATVNAALPAGCEEIPVRLEPSYSIRSASPMRVWVAEALAQWRRAAVDRAARAELDDSMQAENSIMKPLGMATRGQDWWDEEVELLQPVTVVQLHDGATITGGRVSAATGPRRVLAWKFYGVAAAVPADDLDASLEQLDNARDIIRAAAAEHADEAETLDRRL